MNWSFASWSAPAACQTCCMAAGAGAGGATVKLRAAYGSGLRPARTAARTSIWPRAGRLSADLGPESQRGLEAGLDFLAGGGRMIFPFPEIEIV